MKLRQNKLLCLAAVLLAAIFAFAACSPETPAPNPEPHTHTFESGWTWDENNHWHKATCGHTSEKNSVAAHSYDSKGKCTVCGYEKPHVHTFSETWSYDEINHWHAATCEHTSEKDGVAKHTYDADGKCEVCGFVSIAAKFTFQLLDDGTYAVTGVINADSATVADVPATYQGADVTVIGEEAFCYDGCEKLVHIGLPNTITKLETQALWGTEGLKKLTLPDSLQSIEQYALGASGFEEIVIPASVTELAPQIFRQSSVLRKVTFKSEDVALSDYMFWQCPSLREIVFDEGVVAVRRLQYASPFYEVESVEKIYISSTVTKLFYDVMYDQSVWLNQFDRSEFKFSRYEVAEGNSAYSSDANGILYNADKTVLLHAPLKLSGEITVPQSVQTVWKEAFRNVGGVTKVILPEGLTEINRGAFESTGITELTIPDSVTKLGNDPEQSKDSMYRGIVKNCKNLAKLHLGAGVTAKHIDVENELLTLPALEEITVSENSASLKSHNNELLNKEGTYLYFGNDQGEVPDGVVYIEYYAFYGNENITSVTMPSSLIRIGVSAFANCTNLKNVTLSENLEMIFSNAFEGTAIEEITFPASLRNIDNNAFKDCASLRSVTFDRADHWEAVKGETLDLSDPEQNAVYLTETYVDEYWGYNVFA